MNRNEILIDGQKISPASAIGVCSLGLRNWNLDRY